MEWTGIAPIAESYWLKHQKMPLVFPDGVRIDSMTDEYRSMCSNDQLNAFESDRILNAKHAFLFSYQATGRRGITEPMRGEQSMLPLVRQTISLANLSLWISKPNGIVFDAIVHFANSDGTLVSHYSKVRPFRPHMDYANSPLEFQDFQRACSVFPQLLTLDSEGTTWRAIYSLLTALREFDWATRFMQVWIGLEALFGPNDAREINFRISQRIAFFLESDKGLAKELFERVKESYKWRSNIVHGLRLSKLSQEDSRKLSLFVETLISRILLKELADPNTISVFDSAGRESFLDSLAFQK